MFFERGKRCGKILPYVFVRGQPPARLDALRVLLCVAQAARSSNEQRRTAQCEKR